MPTYDYLCSCGYKVEISHKMNEFPQVSCEKCQGLMTKQIGIGGHVKFHGKGFYVNDYKKGKGNAKR